MKRKRPYLVRDCSNDNKDSVGVIRRWRRLQVGDNVDIKPNSVKSIPGHPAAVFQTGRHTVIDITRGYEHPETGKPVTLLRLCRL